MLLAQKDREDIIDDDHHLTGDFKNLLPSIAIPLMHFFIQNPLANAHRELHDDLSNVQVASWPL